MKPFPHSDHKMLHPSLLKCSWKNENKKYVVCIQKCSGIHLSHPPSLLPCLFPHSVFPSSLSFPSFPLSEAGFQTISPLHPTSLHFSHGHQGKLTRSVKGKLVLLLLTVLLSGLQRITDSLKHCLFLEDASWPTLEGSRAGGRGYYFSALITGTSDDLFRGWRLAAWWLFEDGGAGKKSRGEEGILKMGKKMGKKERKRRRNWKI